MVAQETGLIGAQFRGEGEVSRASGTDLGEPIPCRLGDGTLS